MILQIKEDQYNWGDRFYILDENNQRKYFVKSSVLLWNRKVQICDLDKNVLITIRKEPKSLLKKKFYVIVGDEQVAAITQEIPLMPKFTFEGLNWQMNGLMYLCYTLLEQGREVASISEEGTPWGMRAVLNIADSGRELVALGVVMTLSYAMMMRDGNAATKL